MIEPRLAGTRFALRQRARLMFAHNTGQQQNTLPKRDSLRRQVEEIASDAGAVAVSVAFHDYRHKTGWIYQADRWFHAASTIKVPVLAGVYAAADEDELQPMSRVHVRNRFLSVADGSPFRIEASRDANAEVHAAIGKTMRIRELAEHMISTSSNLATNLLLDIVGLEHMRELLHRRGMTGIDLQRGVEDMTAHDAGINNRLTAEGLMHLFRSIVEERVFSKQSCREMMEILHTQEFRSGIPAGLPDDAKVAHKTGEISTIAHDAGVVFLNDREPYVVVILTEWKADEGNRRRTIARLSRAVFDHVTDGDVHG